MIKQTKWNLKQNKIQKQMRIPPQTVCTTSIGHPLELRVYGPGKKFAIVIEKVFHRVPLYLKLWLKILMRSLTVVCVVFYLTMTTLTPQSIVTHVMAGPTKSAMVQKTQMNHFSVIYVRSERRGRTQRMQFVIFATRKGAS